jgi:hypothetical protein
LLVTARGSSPCRTQRPTAAPSLGKLQRRAFRFQYGLAWLQAVLVQWCCMQLIPFLQLMLYELPWRTLHARAALR